MWARTWARVGVARRAGRGPPPASAAWSSDSSKSMAASCAVTDGRRRRDGGVGQAASARLMLPAVDLTPTARARRRSAPRCGPGSWSNLPWEYGQGLPPRFDDLAEEVAFLPRPGRPSWPRAGWVGVAWPEEYGGRGAGPVEHFIVQEELARARAPEMVGRIGINLAGPTLLAHGTAEQKAALAAAHPPRRRPVVPAVQRARRRQRPGVGLRPRADAGRRRLVAQRPEGVDVVRPVRRLGRSAWPAPTRMRPKHKGISYLRRRHARPRASRSARSCSSPARPSSTRSSSTDVFVPRRPARSARSTTGWRVANSTLSHERGTNPRQLVIHIQLLEELLRLADENGGFDDAPLRAAPGPGLRRGAPVPAAQPAQSISRLAKGREPGPEGSALKLYWSEMSKRFHDTAMAVLGPAAPLWKRRRRQPRATAAGSARGSTTRRRRSGPAPTRSSATSSASACSASPAGRRA